MITLGDGASSLCEPLTRSPLGPLSLEKDWIIAAHPKLASSQPGHASDELCAQNVTQQVLKVLNSSNILESETNLFSSPHDVVVDC